MAIKVLIIDDNENYADALKINLKGSSLGFEPHIELTCEGGYNYFKDHLYEVDAILLDVNFDDNNTQEGLALLKKIKDESNVWIGLISQSFKTESVPSELGSDAFFSKEDVESIAVGMESFYRGNLLPRVSNDCKLEFKNNQFFCNDKLIQLEGKQFILMKYLYEKTKDYKTVKSRYEISDETGIANESVKAQVSNIRAKLPKHCRKQIIVSVESKGYYCPFSPPKSN
ncbi:MAG: hypothetical protein NZ824_04700 [Candidatus Thioglobus sp.]|nr:hypothetical protein [Candidatus Thioglobus sp.]